MHNPTGTCSPRHAQARGFNLIELLIAMAVIMTVVALTCVIYTESDDAWVMGTDRAENTAAGRTALNLMTHDLQHAVADQYLSFRIFQDRLALKSYGADNDEVCLVSLQHDSSDTNRTARQIHYWVRQVNSPYMHYELIRGVHAMTNTYDTSATDNSYWNTNWFDVTPTGAGRPPENETGIVAQHVAALRVVDPDGFSDYLSSHHTNQLPEYVDICLELLDGRAAKQAAEMPLARQREFVDKNVRRYTTRVFLRNCYEYKP